MFKDYPNSNPAPSPRYAALAYSASDLLGPVPNYENVIAILLLDSNGQELETRARSDWEEIVPEMHREYISSVLIDFKQRSESDPIQLFIQASNLNVGPIVTLTVGSNLESDSELWNLYRRFGVL